MKTFNQALLSILLCASATVAAPAQMQKSSSSSSRSTPAPAGKTPAPAGNTPTPARYTPPASSTPKTPSQGNKLCDVVDEVLLYLRYVQPTATAYCSSYLHYTSPAPVTVTSTSAQQVYTTLPDATVTVTASVTSQVTNNNYVTAYTPNPTVTSTVVITAPQSTRYVKRDLEQWIPSQISSACSCIVTKNTATPTVTVTVTKPQTQTVGPVHTATVQQTVFVTVTAQVTVQTTLPATSTVVVLETTTTTPAPATQTTSICDKQITFSTNDPNGPSAYGAGYYGPQDTANNRKDCENNCGQNTCTSAVFDPTPVTDGGFQFQMCYFFNVPVEKITPGPTTGYASDRTCPGQYSQKRGLVGNNVSFVKRDLIGTPNP